MTYYKNFDLKSLSYLDEFGFEQTEQWLPVKDYESFYEVSNLGRIKSLLRLSNNGVVVKQRILKQRINISGYLVVTLRKNNKMQIPYVHKLVLIAFIKNVCNKPEGNHKCGIKTDNRASQLDWVTKSENIKHSYAVLQRKPTCPGTGKLGGKHVNARKIICVNTGKEYDAIATAHRELNIHPSSIQNVLSQRLSSIKGLVFKYKLV